MPSFAKIKTSTNIIESVQNNNTAESGYHFKEFISSVAWGSELIGLEVSSEDNGRDGFPHENLFVSE